MEGGSGNLEWKEKKRQFPGGLESQKDLKEYLECENLKWAHTHKLPEIVNTFVFRSRCRRERLLFLNLQRKCSWTGTDPKVFKITVVSRDFKDALH